MIIAAGIVMTMIARPGEQHTRSAHAQAPKIVITLYDARIEVLPSKLKMCIGGTDAAFARVWHTLRVRIPEMPGRSASLYRLDQVVRNRKIDVTVADRSVADVDRIVTDSATSITGFEFIGRKVGTTTVYFEMLVPDPGEVLLTTPLAQAKNARYVTESVTIEVEKCKKKVRAITNFAAAKLAQVRQFQGQMPIVTLTSTDDGGYSGEGTLSWTESINDSSCSTVWTKPSVLKTPAHITATDGEDTTTVVITFESLSHTVCGACFGHSTCLGDSWDHGSVSAVFSSGVTGSQTINVGRFEITLITEDEIGQS